MNRDYDNEIDQELAWRFLLALAKDDAEALDGAGRAVEPDAGAVLVRGGTAPGWRLADGARCTPAARRLLDFYLPLCIGGPQQPLLIAHLGQSLDGRIATECGHSHYVNGPQNIDHLHRLRALFDAVLVGASTVQADNPRLTTRRVVGPNPVRVVLDPHGRLGADLGVFTDDAAPTLLVRAARAGLPARVGQAEVVAVASDGDGLRLPALLAELRRRGLPRLFIEGGGVTVSRFLAQGLLHRLQLTVAPLIIGSGRAAISLPPISDLADGLRPRHRRLPLGEDLLYEFALSDPAG